MSLDIDAELRKVLLAYGETTSDDVIKAEVIKNVVYKAADLLSAGLKLVPSKNFGALDVANFFPSNFEAGSWPMKPGGSAGSQKINFTEWNSTLYKSEVKYVIVDEAKLRELANYQSEFSAKKAAEVLAIDKDHCIIDEIYTHAHASNLVTVAPGNEWNSGAATADPEGDIVTAWGNIYANSNATDEEMKNCRLLVPALAAPALMKLVLIGNVQQTISDYLNKTFKIEVVPTRYYSAAGTTGIQDDAIFELFSENTGIHEVLETNKIPLVENSRLKGVGEEYIIRQFFNTKVMPESATVTTNLRIACIANVI